MIDAPGAALEECPQPRFTPPEPPYHFVWRSRLVDSILNGLSLPLVLLKAPAGYGKSALLASVAANWNRQDRGNSDLLAWFSLSSTDDDPAAFLDGTIEAIRRQLPDFGRTARAALRGQRDARGHLSPLMGLIRDELSQLGKRVYLVLDDFHHLRDSAVLGLVEQTIVDESGPLRLVLSTEGEPPIYLSSLRAGGQLVEIDAAALRLSREEVGELMALRAGAAASEDLVAGVERQTAGWTSAVNLCSVLVARGRSPLPFSRFSPTQHGYRRLVQELLSDLDAPARDLVIKSAFLPDLEPGTLGRTLGVEQTAVFADLLAGLGLPVEHPAGFAGPIRYEPLFRASLRAEGEGDAAPSDMAGLRSSLGDLLCERGDWEGAARFYLEAGRLEAAASAAERGVERALEMGYLDSALRIARSLPNEARSFHPVLKVHEARPLIIRYQVDAARALLVSARPELEALDDRRGLGMQLTRWVSLRLAEGRYEDAKQLAVQGLDHLPSVGSTGDRADMLLLLSWALEYLGELEPAFASASEALDLAHSHHRRHLTVSCLIQLSWIARLRGQLGLSIALAGRAVHWSHGYEGALLTRATLGGGVAICHMELGMVSQGLEIARETLAAGTKLRDTEAQMGAHLALALGHDLSGDRTASEASLAAAMGIAEGLAAGHLGRVRAYQMKALLTRRWRSSYRAGQEAARALAEARAASHQPLIEQCQGPHQARLDRGAGGHPSPIHSPRLMWPAGSWEREGGRSLALRTLGEFLPLVEGIEATWASDDVRVLAAYLLVHRGETVPRERLLAEVWPEVEPGRSSVRLEAALYRLRESLGPNYPPVDGDLEEQNQLRWDGAGISVDADSLLERTGEAAERLGAEHPRVLPADVVGLLESAIASYDGEFLAGMPQPWCLPGRDLTRGRFLWASGLLVDHYLGVRDWELAVRRGLPALKSDPLDETMVHRVMIAYARLGDRASVLSQYRGVKRVLAKERGEWPSEATRNLRIRLLGR